MIATLKRRQFITLLGGVAAAWPFAARAQQGDRRRVGIFMDLAEQDREGQARVAAFREGMQKLGWIEGRNVAYDYRWTAGNPAVMERYAAELVALQPEVIMNGGCRHWSRCRSKLGRYRLFSHRFSIPSEPDLWIA